MFLLPTSVGGSDKVPVQVGGDVIGAVGIEMGADPQEVTVVKGVRTTSATLPNSD